MKISGPAFSLLVLLFVVGACRGATPRTFRTNPTSSQLDSPAVEAGRRVGPEKTPLLPDRPKLRVYVSRRGRPGSKGQAQSPVRTISDAVKLGATQIVLAENGDYDWPKTISTQDIGAIEGRGPKTIIRGLGGQPIRSLSLKSATVRVHSSGADFVGGGRVHFESVKVHCRKECLSFNETAPVFVKTTLRASRSKRVMRMTQSDSSLSEVSVVGGIGAAVQVEGGRFQAKRLSVKSKGSGIVLLDVRGFREKTGAVLEGATIKAGQSAVLVKNSDVLVDQGYYQGTSLAAVSVTGKSRVTIRDADLAAGREGALFVGAFKDQSPEVAVEDSTLSHRKRLGAKLAAGTTRFGRVIFEGKRGRPRKGAESILASGEGVMVHVQESAFQYPLGSAVSLNNGAGLVFDGEIVGSGHSALLLVDAGSPVRVRATISGCRTGYGIESSQTVGIEVHDSLITGCPGGAVLLTDKSKAVVRRSRLVGNGRRNIGVYGFSEALVKSSTVSGSKWAVFSACGDGAVSRVVGSKVDGQVIECR